MHGCDYAVHSSLVTSTQTMICCIDLSGWENIDTVLELVRVNSYCELANCQKHVANLILISAH